MVANFILRSLVTASGYFPPPGTGGRSVSSGIGVPSMRLKALAGSVKPTGRYESLISLWMPSATVSCPNRDCSMFPSTPTFAESSASGATFTSGMISGAEGCPPRISSILSSRSPLRIANSTRASSSFDSSPGFATLFFCRSIMALAHGTTIIVCVLPLPTLISSVPVANHSSGIPLTLSSGFIVPSG